jgi:carboxyl-terminal processing protease
MRTNNKQCRPCAAERTENMYNRSVNQNAAANNQIRRKTAFGNRGGFYFHLQKLPLILLLFLLLPVSSMAENNVSCNRLPMLVDVFLANHYAMKSMTPEIQTQAIEQMLKSLDPSKTLLYESDREKLRPVLQSVFTGMQSGDCKQLRPVYDMLVARAKENETVVKNLLGSDFRMDDTAELNIDVSKRPSIKTADQKRELLRKILQFQIDNTLLTGVDLAEAKKQQIHRYELQTMRVIEHNPEKLIKSVANAFAMALDPHTSYLSPENMEDIKIQMQLSLEGIGAVLSSDNGFTVIEELIPGGGAERSGMLKPKDKIIAVAQKGKKPVNVIDMDLRDVIKMIRGNKGTEVTLTILRQAKQTDRFNITILRDKINIKEQAAKITYETRMVKGKKYRFGVIELPSFYGDEKENKSCYEDVKNLLAEARKQHVGGIVLDLSKNGGGLLDEAVQLAGLFIGDGGIVAVKDSRKKVMILANGSNGSEDENGGRKVIAFPAENPRAIYTGPLVVLTSRLSASASEIVAGALKDYHRAVIVGQDHTFGKGSVQTLIPLPWNLGGMKITTALYFLPGGQSTQKTGVEADVRLPIWFNLDDIGEAALDYPLPSQSIAPFLDTPEGNALTPWRAINQPLIAALASRSAVRIEKNEKFKEIIKNNKEAAARKGLIRLADLRKEMKNDNKLSQTSAERKRKAKDQYLPFVEESVNILLDMVILTP